MQTGNHVVQKFDTRKIYKLSNEVTFFSPFFVCFSLFAFKLVLVRQQCYAYAIGLYTRPEIKSWPDVKFCAHAHCVLPRCYMRHGERCMVNLVPRIFYLSPSREEEREPWEWGWCKVTFRGQVCQWKKSYFPLRPEPLVGYKLSRVALGTTMANYRVRTPRQNALRMSTKFNIRSAFYFRSSI